jgi:hypothetical protein
VPRLECHDDPHDGTGSRYGAAPRQIGERDPRIQEIVTHHVRLYNERAEGHPLIAFLTQEEVDARGAEGKVGFGTRYDDRQANEADAIAAAILAFEDGLYRVFIHDEEATVLDANIDIRDGDDIAFIKFTMLAGRLW